MFSSWNHFGVLSLRLALIFWTCCVPRCVLKASWYVHGSGYLFCKAKKILKWLSETPCFGPDASGRVKCPCTEIVFSVEALLYGNKQRPRTWEQSLFISKLARESATISCVLEETQRQADEWESFMVEKGEYSKCSLIGGCCIGGAGGGLTRSGHSMWLVRGAYLVFSGYS